MRTILGREVTWPGVVVRESAGSTECTSGVRKLWISCGGLGPPPLFPKGKGAGGLSIKQGPRGFAFGVPDNEGAVIMNRVRLLSAQLEVATTLTTRSPEHACPLQGADDQDNLKSAASPACAALSPSLSLDVQVECAWGSAVGP